MSVLALDMGSSSVRAVVCGPDAEPVPGRLARRNFDPQQGEDGRGELDPDVYVANVVACIDELNEGGFLEGVTDVAMSSQWHSVLAIDPAAGRPRGKVLTWLDTRAVPSSDAPDPVAFHNRTGAWVHPLYWTAKIPWLVEHRPGPSRFLGLPDYVRRILLGSDDTSVSMASGTGMLELESCTWDAEALSLAGVSEADLPAISEADGELVGRWRERWPALVSARWHPVVGDGAASNLGTGCGSPDAIAITLGTSMALRVVHTDPLDLPWDVWRYRVDSKRYVSGIAYSGGGVLHWWGVGLLRLDAHHEPTDVRPGASGLVVLPLHAGGRPPSTHSAGSGAVFGLSLDTSSEEFLAGTMDGVSMQAAVALDELGAMVGGPYEVAIGGGAVHASAWWRQSLAAAFGRTVRHAVHAEVGARGAAAVALDLVPSLPTDEVVPDPDDVTRMAELRPRYEMLCSALDSANGVGPANGGGGTP